MKHTELDILTGKLIKEIRQEQGYTRKWLCEQSADMCSVDYLGKIENGKVGLNTRTIYPILDALNTRIDDFFNRLYGQDIQKCINDFNIAWDLAYEKGCQTLSAFLDELKAKDYDMSIPVIKQMALLCEGIIHDDVLKQHHIAYNILMKALLLTSPQNIVHNNSIICKLIATKSFIMNEYRILIAMANSKMKIENIKESTRILSAICSSLELETTKHDIKKKLLPITYFNLSNTLIKMKNYMKTLNITEKGISFCLNTNEFKELGFFHVNKARALYYMGCVEEATECYKSSLEIFKGQGKVANVEYVTNAITKDYPLCTV